MTGAERFDQFHQENPHVYDILVRLAREWKATGRNRIGIATLYERLRWEIAMITSSDEDYKINDRFRAYYARLILVQEPDLAGMFELRASEADEWIVRRMSPQLDPC